MKRCGDCGETLHGGLCESCEGHRAAHDALYGHEECRSCGRVLVYRDEQEANECRRCSGVEDEPSDDE